MRVFVLLHEDFFSLLFAPSFYSVQFPAAVLLSLFFSLLHLSFQTHSGGVRFLQLVHISAPISLTASASLDPFFILSLLLYLMLTSASRAEGGFRWVKTSELILIHSCNVLHLLTLWFLNSPILIFLPSHSFPSSFVLILPSFLHHHHQRLLHSQSLITPSCTPPLVWENKREHKPAHISIPGSFLW